MRPIDAGTLVFVDQGNIILRGDQDALSRVVEPLMELGIRARRLVDAPAVAAATGGGSTTEQIRLSPASLDLLRTHGAVPGESGFFRMFVQDKSGKIAGQLQWEQVNLGVEQALSMQTAAVTLALRAAIADVPGVGAADREQARPSNQAASLSTNGRCPRQLPNP